MLKRFPKFANVRTEGFCLVVWFRRNFSTKFLNTQLKLNKTVPQAFECHTAASKNITKLNQTQFVIQDKAITSQDVDNSHPIYCEKDKDKFTSRAFYNDHRPYIAPITHKKFSLEEFFLFKIDMNENNFAKRSQFPFP